MRILIALVVAMVAQSNYCIAEDGINQIETYVSPFKEFRWINPSGESDELLPSWKYKLQYVETTNSSAPAQNRPSAAIKPEGKGGFVKRLMDAYVEEFKGGPSENGPDVLNRMGFTYSRQGCR